MINIKETDFNILKNILKQIIPDKEIWAFASRVNGSYKEYSDLDIVIKNNISERTINNLKLKLSESNLSITIDIIQWEKISESFRNIILSNYEVIS